MGHAMAKFKLIFLGTGSAFTVSHGNYHSNMLLINTENDDKLLIDCGSDVRHSLAERGFGHRDIRHVYISHLHADHAGGMEWLALSSKFDPTVGKPIFYATPVILQSIWNDTLRGGLSTIQGMKADLPLFFDLQPTDEDGVFVWNGIPFQTVQTIHVMNNFGFMPSFGLLFTLNKTKIFITTDTQFAPAQLQDFYRQVDIIFHDCETSEQASGVHATFQQLSGLAPEIKAKMWLYHYNTATLPDAVAHGFCGFVTKGQCFRF